MKRHILTVLLLLVTLPSASSQTLTYSEFIQAVMDRNLALKAEQTNVEISEAQVQAARSIENPTLSVEYGNNSDWSIAMGQSLSIGLEQTITPGVTVARRKVARAEHSQAVTALREYELALRVEATLKYLDALMARDMLEVAHQTMENMIQLAESDSLRYTRGDISQLDMMQTRLEARVAQQDYATAAADYANALVTLDMMMGDVARGTRQVAGEATRDMTIPTLAELLSTAQEKRPDLQVAEQSIVVAQQQERLTRRERVPEFDLSLGVSLNSRVANEEAPAPEFIGYTVGLGMPLPFSAANKGSLKASRLAVKQAQLTRDASAAQVQTEVIQAYNNCLLAQQTLKTYDTQLLSDAGAILQGRLYAYRRGETALLEVLSAQQTYNEVRHAYIEALYNNRKAFVELQGTVGNTTIAL